MTSEAQIQSNRANARHSTGPKTEEGKKRASINAYRHGLTGQFYAMSAEDDEAFRQHRTSIIDELNPQTYREKQLAIAIAEDLWRLTRARAIENNIFALGHSTAGEMVDANSAEVHTAVTHARVWLADAKNIQLLALYETRIRRSVEKNEKQLEALQTTRKGEYETALEEAQLLAQLAFMKGQSYDPATDFPPESGFVFSAAQINARIQRSRRLDEAKFFKNNAWNRRANYRGPGHRVPQSTPHAA